MEMKMATLKAKRLQDALKRAKRVGRAEEAVTIDGCSLVLQNLSPEDYEQILQETKDLDDAEYVHAFQIGHVCRAIVELEGIDLRDVSFIEDDVPVGNYLLNAVIGNKGKAEKALELLEKAGIDATLVPPDEASTKTVQLERHEWLRQRLATWAREAIHVAYRKFAGVVVAGEQKAKEGVVFQLEDEGAEDKFRRLLGEAKELEAELPPELVETILKDSGYLHGSTPEEIAAMKRRTEEWALEQAQARKQEQEAPEPEVVPVPEPEPEPEPDRDEEEYQAQLEALQASFEAKKRAKQQQEQARQELAERLKARQPLNQLPMSPPAPTTPKPVTPAVPPGAPVPVGVPEQLRQKMAKIAELEGQVDPNLMAAIEAEQQALGPHQREVRELVKQPPLDVKQLVNATDRPPVVGINPRFRPQR